MNAYYKEYSPLLAEPLRRDAGVRLRERECERDLLPTKIKRNMVQILFFPNLNIFLTTAASARTTVMGCGTTTTRTRA